MPPTSPLNSPSSNKALRLELKNRREWERVLASAQEMALDLRVPLTQIGRGLFNWTEIEIFRDGAKGPGKYQDLSPRYKALKLKRWKFIYPVLRASGSLERSVTGSGDGNTIFRFPDATTLEWGTSVPHGIYHQSERPRSKIPRRPFLIVTNPRLKQWTTIMQKHINKAFVQPIATFNPGGTD